MERNFHPEQPIHYRREDQEALQELAVKFGANSYEYNEYLRVLEEERIANGLNIVATRENPQPLLRLINDVIKAIDSVELEEPLAKNAKLLAIQKEKAKENIKKLLSLAGGYVESIDRMQRINVNKETLEPIDYRKRYEESDAQRRRSHNALLDQAAITSRFIIYHFGEISEKQLEKFEEKEEKEGREILEVKRVKLPGNLLWPAKVNLHERNSVRDWAILVTQELAQKAQKSHLL
jgi:hypothetical protein